MKQLLGIDPSKVYSQQCLYEEHLRGFCARFPEEGFRAIQDRVHSGAVQLWIVWDNETAQASAVVGTELTKGADGRTTANILFCAGRGARFWIHLISDIETWARRNGAYRVRTLLRPGWERLLAGYRKSSIVLERTL